MPSRPPSNQILTVAQMQAAEQALIDAGTSVDELMHMAGRSAADWVWRVAAGRAVTVLCGPGNNGGDGYVIAEALRERGLPISVVAPIAPATPAAANARRALKMAVASSGKDANRTVLVDCLFGSGLSRPLSGELHLLLQDLAARHEYRIAIDVPSGIASDDGALLNGNLPDYTLTLALGAWKYAHWLMPSAVKMGERRWVDIGITSVAASAELIGPPNLYAPAAADHKYTRGLCAVRSGAMPGAALLSCQAAMRAGAGYVKLLGDDATASSQPDLVVERGTAARQLDDPRISALLIGPGLGRGDTARKHLSTAVDSGFPLVLDADALLLLKPGMLRKSVPCLATPHEGELKHLCRSFAVIASGKVEKAKALAQASNMVILAKGPDTVAASPDGRVAIAPAASSWLSTAGSGDVLAGIAASRMANGCDPFEAACQAVWLHTEAARLAGPAFTASELAGKVADAYATCL